MLDHIRGFLKSDIAQAVLLLFGLASLALNSVALLLNGSPLAQSVACIGITAGVYLTVSSALNLLLGPPQE